MTNKAPVFYDLTTSHLQYDDNGTPVTIPTGGDVAGPGSAVSGHLAVFADTTGKVLSDGGAVPSGGSGSDIVSLKSYGAIGDGTTNDTTAVQAAFNAGKNIYVPDGTYLIDAITVGNSINVLGSGKNKAIFKLRTVATNMITATSKTGVSFDGIGFLGSNGNSANEVLFYAITCTDVTLTNCGFKSSVIGLQIQQTTNSKVVNCDFEDMKRLADASLGYGVLFNLDNDGIICAGNHFKDIRRHPVYVSAGSSNAVVSDNIMKNSGGTVVSIYTTDAQNVSRNIQVINNIFDGTNTTYVSGDEVAGVLVTGYIDGLLIEGNQGYNLLGAYGVKIQNGADHAAAKRVRNAQVLNNKFDTTGKHGIYFYNCDIESCKNNVIKTVGGTTQDGISILAEGTGVSSYASVNNVTDNIIDTTTGYGIRVLGGGSTHRAAATIGKNTINNATSGKYNVNSYSDITTNMDTFRPLFFKDNIGSSLTDSPFAIGGTQSDVQIPFDGGFITRLLVRPNSPLSSGTFTFKVIKNGAATSYTKNMASGEYYCELPIPLGDLSVGYLNTCSVWVSSGTVSPTTIDCTAQFDIVRAC